MKSPRRNGEKVFPSKYEVDIVERRDFRNRVRMHYVHDGS
jgi:hypothetical protein